MSSYNTAHANGGYTVKKIWNNNGFNSLPMYTNSSTVDISKYLGMEIDKDVIKEEAIRAEQYYVDKRWLGGTMTNFKTLRKSIAKLHRYEEMAEDGTFDLLPKKEVIGIKKEQVRLEAFFGGIKNVGR